MQNGSQNLAEPRSVSGLLRQRLALFGPPLFVALALAVLGVEVLFKDEWDVIGAFLIELKLEGLRLAPLWLPQNEHRIPLPRLLFALLHGRGTHIVLGMELNLAVMGLSFAVLYRRVLAEAVRAAAFAPVLLSFLFSALYFSFGQKENLFMSSEIFLTLVMLGLIVSAFALASGDDRLFFAGLGLSYLCGPHWVTLMPLAVIDSGHRLWRARKSPAMPAVAIAAAARLVVLILLLAIYTKGLPASSLAVFKQFALSHPLAVVKYFVAFLGDVHFWHGADPTEPLALLGGLLFLSLWIFLFLSGALRPSHPEFYLTLLTLALAALTCSGRAPLGARQALDSRYQAGTVFGWVALLAALLRSSGRRPWARWLVVGCLLNVLISSVSALRTCVVLDSPTALQGKRCQEEFLKSGRTIDRPECRGVLYPNPKRQEQLTLELHKLGLLSE